MIQEPDRDHQIDGGNKDCEIFHGNREEKVARSENLGEKRRENVRKWQECEREGLREERECQLILY